MRAFRVILFLLFCFSSMYISVFVSASVVNEEIIKNLQLEVDRLKAERVQDHQMLLDLQKKCHNHGASKLLDDFPTAENEKQTETLLQTIEQNTNSMQSDLHNFLRKHQVINRRSRRHSKDRPYSDLAVKLERVRRELLSIKLLEDQTLPTLQTSLQFQGNEIRGLLNLTNKLTEELRRLELATKYSSKNVPYLVETDENAEQLFNKIADLSERVLQIENFHKWTEFFGERIHAELQELKQNTGATLASFDERLTKLENGSSTSDFQPNINSIPIVIEGSGEEQISSFRTLGDVVEKVVTIEQQQNNQRKNMISWREKLDEKLQKHITKVEQSFGEKLHRISGTKAERKQVDAILKILNGAINGVRTRLNTVEDFSQKSNVELLETMRKLHTDLNRMKLDVKRSVTVAEVIKDVQSDHFSELQRFKKAINNLETDLLKFGLKLTGLQADYLNSTLYLYQESKKDMHQDTQIAKILLQQEATDFHVEDLSDQLSTTNRKLDDKVDYNVWKYVSGQMDLVGSKLTNHGAYLKLMKKDVEWLRGGVVRLESQLPNDCTMHPNLGSITYHNGLYVLKPLSANYSVETLCDMDDSGGGWTVIQKRFSGQTNFNRSWAQYANGFGNPAKEDFWLGNHMIHLLTSNPRNPFALRVETWDIYNDYRFADYDFFRIESRKEHFRLNLGPYLDGNLTDAMSYHDSMKFSTFDLDLDASSTHCARYYAGGWWYAHCQKANLNGNFKIGMVWFNNATGDWMQLKRTVMKIRPVRVAV